MKKSINLAMMCLSIFVLSNCKKSSVNDATESSNSKGGRSNVSVGGTLKIPVKLTGLGTVKNTRHLFISDDYVVYAKRNGEADALYKEVPVYKTDNYFKDNTLGIGPRPQNAASFCNFSFSSTWVDIKIVCKNITATSVTLRPKNSVPVKTTYFSRNGNEIKFTLRSQAKLSIEVNDRINPLFLFGNALEVPPSSATYFYRAGTITDLPPGYKILNSGESVYIEGGAVVEGQFKIAHGATNVSIKGHGILNNGKKGAPTGDDLDIGKMQAFSTIQARYANSNIDISDITISNSKGWTLQMEGYNGDIHDNTYTNLKIINWNISSDGIHLDGDRITVDNCFIFNNDDLLTTRGSNNCLVKNCIVWGGAFGNLFMQNAFNPSNTITYDNIDVIGKDGTYLSNAIIEIQPGSGDHNIENITFKNIRVEERRLPYTKFVDIRTNGQNLKNWLFQNITLDNKKPNEGEISGTANGRVDIVKFINFRFGSGSALTDFSQTGITKNSYVTNVTVTP